MFDMSKLLSSVQFSILITIYLNKHHHLRLCTDHPAMSLDISDRNLVAMAVGRSVHVLQDAFTKPTDLTYLKHTIRTPNPSLSSGGTHLYTLS
jgi:hypothetical protein